MQIKNIRIGFATNSSSSHSILLNCDGDEFTNEDSMEYGWGDFLLKSKMEKALYMLAQMFKNLESYYYRKIGAFDVTQDTGFAFNCLMEAAEIIKDFGFDFRQEIAEKYSSFDVFLGVGVDHQSVITFPTKYNSIEIDLDFAKELFDYIVLNDKISIAGGNDNDDSYEYGGEKSFVDCLRETTPSWCRKDSDTWTLFSPVDGKRITLNFKE